MYEKRVQDAHIGVVTGLADIVNFLAVLQRRIGSLGQAGSNVKALLFGQPKSLPAQLKAEFFEIVRRAAPFIDTHLIPPERVGDDAFFSNGYAPLWLSEIKGRRIVYSNGIHKSFHQSFYEWLAADEIVFFDNGLSSYADHKADIRREFSKRNLPVPKDVYLALHPPLPAPAYLSCAQIHSIGYDDFADIYERLRSATPSAPRKGRLPENVIVGTSLFRTGRIRWNEERDIYLRLIDFIKKSSPGEIMYKAHPRASDRPLIVEADGVEVIDNSVPVEAFAAPGSKGVAYSISSTALITLTTQFGWRSFRVEDDKTRELLAKSPHLSKIDFVDAIRL